jgi:signal transduction histidine kinase
VAKATSDRGDVTLHGELAADVNTEAAEMVLRELLDNARDAIAKSVRVESAMNDSTVTLRVTNTGIPLHAREVASLFTPWFTTKEGHAGLGLYLASSALIEAGGEIHLAHEQPVTFVVTMPTSRR